MQPYWTLVGDDWVDLDEIWNPAQTGALDPDAVGVLRVRFDLPRNAAGAGGSRLRAVNIHYRIVGGDVAAVTPSLTRFALAPEEPSPESDQCVVPHVVATASTGFDLAPNTCQSGTLAVVTPQFDEPDDRVFYDFDVAITAGEEGASLLVDGVEAEFDFTARP